MVSKNPLEEIRCAILESQLFGVENEISQMGVSEELLEISDALDSFYGIKRQEEPDTFKVMGGVYKKINPDILNIMDNPWGKKFRKTTNMVKQVKMPLNKMKQKLSKDNPIYLNLSSAIVSIALKNVISSVNAYQKPAYHDYKRYDLISGIDKEWSSLVSGGLEVFNELNSFDMTKDCYDNYETNRKTILSMAKSIQDTMLHPSRNYSTKSSSSGCLVLALALSTSIMVCWGVFVVFLL